MWQFVGGVDFQPSCLPLVHISQHKHEFVLHLHNALYIYGSHSWMKTCNDLGLDFTADGMKQCNVWKWVWESQKIGHNHIKARNKRCVFVTIMLKGLISYSNLCPVSPENKKNQQRRFLCCASINSLIDWPDTRITSPDQNQSLIKRARLKSSRHCSLFKTREVKHPVSATNQLGEKKKSVWRRIAMILLCG